MDDIFLNSKSVKEETENELLNYALHYARCGHPVIPLHNLIEKNGILQCSCRDALDCSFAGKHPRTRYGSKDATTDEIEIYDWWTKHPQSNIGLLTGKATGFFVLDIDIRTEKYPVCHGEYTLESMNDYYRVAMKNYDPLSATLTAFSGSGSRHLYFKYPLELTIKNSASEIGTGLDIKSDGGYIVAPPSNHKSGKKYKWFGVNIPICEAPRWLIYETQIVVKKFKKESNQIAYQKSVIDSNEKIPVTQRNNYLLYVFFVNNGFYLCKAAKPRQIGRKPVARKRIGRYKANRRIISRITAFVQLAVNICRFVAVADKQGFNAVQTFCQMPFGKRQYS